MSEPQEQPKPGADLPQLYRGGALTRPGRPVFHPEPEGEEGLSLERYLRILLRRKWALIAVAVTAVAVSALEVYTTTPTYRASARLQIDPEEMRVLPYQDIDDSSRRFDSYQYQMTQLEKLRSRDLAGRVVERLDLEDHPDFHYPVRAGVISRLRANLRQIPSSLLRLVAGRSAGSGEGAAPRPAAADAPRPPGMPDPAVLRIQYGLQAQVVGDTRLIEVTYTSPVPAFAATVANAAAEEFVRLHLESRYRATIRATEFLQTELDELKIKVEKSEQELLRYAREKNIVNLNERETLIRKKLADLTDELTAVESELIGQAAIVRVAESSGADDLPDVLKDERLRGLEASLAALESELAGLSSRYGSEWPRVKELRKQIDEGRAQLASGRRGAVGSVRQTYNVLKSRYDRLAAAVAEQRESVEQLDNDSIQYNILKREAETNQQLYDGLLQRLKEAGVAAGLESSNIHVAEAAIVPTAAAYPQKARSLTRALLLGLVLGLGVVVLLESLDKTVKTVEDVQSVAGLPSLGIVPVLDVPMNGKKGMHLGRRRQTVESRPVLASSGLEFLRGQEWEAYRSLRTALLLAHSGQPPQVILVTSPGPGEGKTTTAANLAVALAQTGGRALMVDLDLRKPVLAASFNLPEGKGMSTYLSGNSDLSSQIQQTGFTNLYLVPAGPPPPNPPELIGSTRMAKGIELLREYFNYIIIDSPPALQLSDAYVASQHVDGLILVARAAKTPKQALRKAGQQFLSLGATVFGVVVNAVDVKSGEYGEYYRPYGYGPAHRPESAGETTSGGG